MKILSSLLQDMGCNASWAVSGTLGIGLHLDHMLGGKEATDGQSVGLTVMICVFNSPLF